MIVACSYRTGRLHGKGGEARCIWFVRNRGFVFSITRNPFSPVCTRILTVGHDVSKGRTQGELISSRRFAFIFLERLLVHLGGVDSAPLSASGIALFFGSQRIKGPKMLFSQHTDGS